LPRRRAGDFQDLRRPRFAPMVVASMPLADASCFDYTSLIGQSCKKFVSIESPAAEHELTSLREKESRNELWHPYFKQLQEKLEETQTRAVAGYTNEYGKDRSPRGSRSRAVERGRLEFRTGVAFSHNKKLSRSSRFEDEKTERRNFRDGFFRYRLRGLNRG
jgi:hypothetical protein